MHQAIASATASDRKVQSQRIPAGYLLTLGPFLEPLQAPVAAKALPDNKGQEESEKEKALTDHLNKIPGETQNNTSASTNCTDQD